MKDTISKKPKTVKVAALSICAIFGLIPQQFLSPDEHLRARAVRFDRLTVFSKLD